MRSPYLKVGYFAQHQLEQLDVTASPLEHLRSIDPRIGENGVPRISRRLPFSRRSACSSPSGPFSGGEKARLALALVVYGKPNLLLLDEPTNHLDLDLRHALEIALQDYAGALVLVSHDRHLLESTCDSLWRVVGGAVQPFDGDLDDYARWLAQREREYEAGQEQAQGDGSSATPATAPRLNPKEQRRAAAGRRAREKALRDAVKRAEAQVESLNEQLAGIERELLDPDAWQSADRSRLAKAQRQQKELRRQLAEAEEAWLQASGELES